MSMVNFENDKYIPTPLPEICAPRQELLKLFDSTVHNRLTVIRAPAGYGKTVSALLWIQTSGRRPVWISLDEYDNVPFLFYKLFCNGIRSVQPDNKKMDEILNSKTFLNAPVEHTINLLSEFPQDGHSYALILDDLHTITNKQILKALPYIFKRMPHSFHILLLSRYNMSEELEEFVENRKMEVITANELAFSAEEIQNYYSWLGKQLTKEQAKKIFETTGGWAMGINAISQNRNLVLQQDCGQILNKYINKNMWDKWDWELREFMLLTSVADEIDTELCQILTGNKKVSSLLDKLVAQNLFIVKTSQNSYRYHHLFSEFLRNKLKERNDIDVQELILKVADFYSEQQEVFKALTYYIRAENHDGINKCFFQLNTGYSDFSVEEWLDYFTTSVFDKLPDEFIKNNIALVIEAVWSNYVNGNAEATLRYIDLVYDFISIEQNLNMLRSNDFLGFICSIRVIDFRRSIYKNTEDFLKWITAIPGSKCSNINIYTATITENFPFMHRSICDCLDITLDMDTQLQSIKEVFGAFFSEEADLIFYCVKAGLYYETDKLEKAYEAIMLAPGQIKKSQRVEIRFCVYMALSQISYAMGEIKASKNARAQFFEHIKEENAFYLNPNFLAIDTKLKLWDTDQGAAKIWLEQLFVTSDEQLRFYKLYQYFTTARAYIVLSEPEKAFVYLKKLKKLSSDYCRPLDIAETGVLLAALQWSTGSRQEAVQTLEEVLLAMQPYNAVRIIAEEGAAALPILKKIAGRMGKTDYSGQLDSRYLNQVLLSAYEVSKRHKGITANISQKSVKLSKQQKHVLSLLAQGYKNAEIVEMTGLTINTIRAHTKIVYQKLDVNKAADAVIVAKQLGLLEP